ncbi:MAG: IS110 family transposase, partial [Dehalococcoidia bacterium]
EHSLSSREDLSNLLGTPQIVIVRMRWHEPTRAYVGRRTAEGLSKKDIIRCLKRYVAREVYGLLPTIDVVPEPLQQAA